MLNIAPDIFNDLYDLPIIEFPWRNEKLLQYAREYHNLGLIREFSGIFNASKIGYHTSLIACKICSTETDIKADMISEHPGVSHNYLRDNCDYNLWFTFSAPENDFTTYLNKLMKQTGTEYFRFDCVRKYKLAFDFGRCANRLTSLHHNINNSKDNSLIELHSLSQSEQYKLLKAIEILQAKFPICEKPFGELSKMSNGLFKEQELITYARQLKQIGLLKRIGAIWHHRKLGLTYNVLCLWLLPQEQIDDFGNAAARYSNITHCYQRVSYPNWPWQIYTMIHGQNQSQYEQTINQLRDKYPRAKLLELPTIKEYKKKRVKYEIKSIFA